jgi:tRNA-dihydrouridine synthase B
MRCHYVDMLEHYGRVSGMRIARKHVGWYTKGLPKSAEFRAAVNHIPDPDDVLAKIDEFYKALCDRAQAA